MNWDEREKRETIDNLADTIFRCLFLYPMFAAQGFGLLYLFFFLR